jgi:RNA polymerase sigma-70 factor (ECF subfamily)
MADLKEKELLASLKNDEKSAMKILFQSYHTILCSIAFRLVRDQDMAKDLVQDVFVKIWNHRHSIDINYSLEAYLKRSVVNTSLNYLEKIQRNRHIEVGTLKDHPEATKADQDHSFSELSKHVDKAIGNLPARTRAVFILIRQEEMSYKEVSESLQISIKAVEKEMMKALRLMRENLRDFLPAVILLGTLV